MSHNKIKMLIRCYYNTASNRYKVITSKEDLVAGDSVEVLTPHKHTYTMTFMEYISDEYFTKEYRTGLRTVDD